MLKYKKPTAGSALSLETEVLPAVGLNKGPAVIVPVRSRRLCPE